MLEFWIGAFLGAIGATILMLIGAALGRLLSKRRTWF